MSIKTSGFEAMNRRLQNLTNLKRGLAAAGPEIGQIVQTQMQTYPPPVPTYHRTYTLRASMRFRVLSRPDGVRIENYSAGASQGRGYYEEYVKDRNRQAWMHAGRWPTQAGDLIMVKGRVLEVVRQVARDAVR